MSTKIRSKEENKARMIKLRSGNEDIASLRASIKALQKQIVRLESRIRILEKRSP